MILDAATIPDLQSRMVGGRLTAVELTEAYLARIRELEPKLNSILFLDPTAVAQGRYDGVRKGGVASAVDCRQHACAAAVRAEDDLVRFDHALDNALPEAQTTLKCDPAAGAVTDVYDGVCRIKIDWSERALAKGGEASLQSLVWVFQP